VSKLRISPDLTFPLELVTESVAILAARRAGKSHTAKKLTEQLHRAGQQFVVVDPKGDWWGLRSSADGKGPGLPVVILGGEHGDVPLEVGAGELVAKLVVEQRVSLVLDLSEFRKNAIAQFMTAFLETLYRMKARDQYRTPLMLVIDEADAIAPQKPYKGEERMLGAAEDIVRRGGQRGIGIIMVSQRAAVLNKNVLTQCGVLILLRTTGSQDIDAVDEWIKKHGQPDERAMVMGTIAAMPRGTAWVWAPGWPTPEGIFRQVEVSAIETFDSGATPKPGQKQVRPKTVADVDLEAFRREMATTIEKAKQEDPRELRRRIAELERAARSQKAPAAAAATKVQEVVKRIEVPILKDGQLKRLEGVSTRLVQFGERVVVLGQDVVSVGREITAALAKVHQAANGGSRAAPAPRPLPAARPPIAPRAPSVRQTQRSPEAGERRPRSGARRMLEAIARRYPTPTTEAQCAQLAKVKRSGGTFGTYKSDLVRGGYMTEGFELTDLGWREIGMTPGEAAPQTTEELLQLYAGTIRAGARRMVDALMQVYPTALTREDLSNEAQVALDGGTFGTYLSDLRKAGLIEDSGDEIRASELLMNPAGASAG
jgi:hypothetical protein